MTKGKYAEAERTSAPSSAYTRCDFFGVCPYKKQQKERICYYKTDKCEFRRAPRIRSELERKLKKIIWG